VHKSPGADVRLPAVREPETEDQDRKQTRYGIASAQCSGARGATGRRRGASYRGCVGAAHAPDRWGTKAHGTPGREGDTGQNDGWGGRPERP
jgi:hypothetical protein